MRQTQNNTTGRYRGRRLRSAWCVVAGASEYSRVLVRCSQPGCGQSIARPAAPPHDLLCASRVDPTALTTRRATRLRSCAAHGAVLIRAWRCSRRWQLALRRSSPRARSTATAGARRTLTAPLRRRRWPWPVACQLLWLRRASHGRIRPHWAALGPRSAPSRTNALHMRALSALRARQHARQRARQRPLHAALHGRSAECARVQSGRAARDGAA